MKEMWSTVHNTEC